MQQPPQIAPPGLAQVTYAGAMGGGYGTSFQQQQTYGDLGGQMAGAGFGNFIGNTAVPAAVYGGQTIAMFGAPMMAASASSLWRGTGHFLNAADPFTHVGSWGKAGWAAGHGATAWRDLKAAKNIGGALRAGMGVARGGLMAAGSGFLPLAVGMAATEVAIKAGEYVAHGAQENFTGAALMKNIGTQFGGGASHGAEIGRMLHDVGQDVGKSVSEMADMARSMDQMKMFQTTRDVKEFKKRFTEIMDTVKEVARTMQTSVDEALGVVGDLRSQGFYTTADIKTASLKQKARGMASGMSQDQLSQFGAMGSNYARQLGMRGRFGADFAQQQAVGVRTALREGYMSEEDVMERGGPDAVAASLAATQMRFLGSARGRVMIANMMGGGSEMDHNRVNNFLSGDMSLESMVTGAAGRGLGVLTAAGGAQAKENAMQYAGMGMVSIAAAQSKQLGGRFSTLDMLSGMAGGRGQAELLMQQTLAMPETLRQQHEAEYSAAQMAAYEERRQYNKVGARMGRYFSSSDLGVTRGLGTRLSRFGSDMGSDVKQRWGDVTGFFGREDVVQSGGAADLELANKYAAGLGSRADRGHISFDEKRSTTVLGSAIENVLGGWDPYREGRILGAKSQTAIDRETLGVYTKDERYVAEGVRGDYENLGRSNPFGQNQMILKRDRERAERLIENAGQLTSEQSRYLRGSFLSAPDAVDTAQKYLATAGLDPSTFHSARMSREQRNAYTLAMATDHRMGRLGQEGSILGERTGPDKDFTIQLQARMQKEAGGSDYFGRGQSFGSRFEGRQDFEESIENFFGQVAKGDFAAGIGGVSKEKEFKKLLRTNEGTRKAFHDYLQALQSGNTEAANNATLAFDGVAGGETLKQIAARALSDSNFRATLSGAGSAFALDIQDFAYSEQRGKSYDSFRAGAKRGKGMAGGRYDAYLSQMEDEFGITKFGKTTSSLVENILKGKGKGGWIDDEEFGLMTEVFGGERAANFRGGFQKLLAGDKKQADALGIDLGDGFSSLSEGEKVAKIIEQLAAKNLLDPAAFGGAGGTTVGDTRVAYVEANSRFVAAVNRFVGNLKTELGEDWMPVDVSDLLTEPK
jgi:hypothetical protein